MGTPRSPRRPAESLGIFDNKRLGKAAGLPADSGSAWIIAPVYTPSDGALQKIIKEDIITY